MTEETPIHRKSINLRLLNESQRVRAALTERKVAGLGLPPHTEAYRCVLVVRATSRDIEWGEVPNPLPSNPFDIDIDALAELCDKVKQNAEHSWFQHSPTNVLLADALAHLGTELERYTEGDEPKAYSGRRSIRDENHPFEQYWIKTRLKN